MFVTSFCELHKVIYGARSQAGAGQVRGLATQATSISKSRKPAGASALDTRRGAVLWLILPRERGPLSQGPLSKGP